VLRWLRVVRLDRGLVPWITNHDQQRSLLGTGALALIIGCLQHADDAQDLTLEEAPRKVYGAPRQSLTLNHPGFGRDSLLGSGDQADQVAQFVQGLELDRWPTSAGSVQSTVVIPIHPCRSGDVDFSNSMPRPARFNQLGLVQAYQ
jgi:hypothetical protein